ncbi:hypothetical protein [Pseudanabaena yagii]|uniref:Uncharacterized protein n=1 Tax=Pseudanabaena yagii GIHE-NHR1 TaxID=2722753 RepID=A0ABX1LQM6_9CYAN|nr:hypothetical protein [Pseudanabaena yagii]NMF57104.1 hypothetical protein [Pseudanabaena yagii GIHE-NHR1]
MGVLFLLLQFLEPVYSQTSLNGCLTNAANAQSCVRDGLISPSNAASAVRGAIVNPNPTNPFFAGTLPSKEAITIAGGVAALGYLGSQAMQNLQNQAMSQAPADYSSCTVWYPVPAFSGVPWMGSGSFPSATDPVGLAFCARLDPSGCYMAPSPSCTASPATPQSAAQGLTDPQIYAEAAAAAAAAARDFANKKDVAGAQTAAAAAAGAAGLVNGNPAATQADKDKANGAAAAAAAAAADAADPTKAPTTPQNPGFVFSRTNFLAYAVSAQGFGNKFPFGMFAPLPASNTQMACPVITSWGTSAQLCFIRDIVRVIKWIVWTNFAIYCFVNL